jgi:zinc transport system ATP-binding protein
MTEQSNPQQLISLRNVSAGYEGRVVVSNVSLDINSDTFVAFIGPNGGGKTTILRTLLGQIAPMSGEMSRLPNLKIGYLPQINDYDLQFPITVRDVVLSGQLDGHRLFPKKATLDRVDELLHFAMLDNLQDRPIGALSGGQRQRAFLCRAIMGNPQLLILDEPVTYMDKVSETNLYKLLPELSKHMAIVLVSHDIGTVAGVVKTIACVNRTLYYHPTNRITDSMLKIYECPVELVTHGAVPHRVLINHHS